MKNKTEANKDKRFNKFLKSRKGRLLDLKQDIEASVRPYSGLRINRMSYLVDALRIVTEKTQLESDAFSIIRSLCPEYFDSEINENENENENTAKETNYSDNFPSLM